MYVKKPRKYIYMGVDFKGGWNITLDWTKFIYMSVLPRDSGFNESMEPLENTNRKIIVQISKIL